LRLLRAKLFDNLRGRVGQRYRRTFSGGQILELASAGGKFIFAGNHGQAKTATIGILELLAQLLGSG